MKKMVMKNILGKDYIRNDEFMHTVLIVFVVQQSYVCVRALQLSAMQSLIINSAS